MAKKPKTGANPPRERGDVESRKRAKLDEAIRLLERTEVERAVERATHWAKLVVWLEELLDDCNDLSRIRVSEEDAASDYRARMRGPKSDRPRNRDDARDELERFEARFVARRLTYARNWASTLDARKGDLFEEHAGSIARLIDRLGAVNPEQTPRNAFVIAEALKTVRLLFEADRLRAKNLASVPPGEDLDLLSRLRGGPKTGKELAVEIANGKRIDADDVKRVTRQVERLRHSFAFDLPNVRGSGYSLSVSDRKRLDDARAPDAHGS